MTPTTATIAPQANAITRASIVMSTGAIRAWLRIEGAAAFAAGLLVFGVSGGSWLLLIPLLLLPDVSAIGYLAGPRVGAFTYNMAHTWMPGFIALGVGVWLAAPVVLLVAAILIAHVGMDRAMGYGLKLPTSFNDTHLGRIGRSKA